MIRAVIKETLWMHASCFRSSLHQPSIMQPAASRLFCKDSFFFVLFASAVFNAIPLFGYSWPEVTVWLVIVRNSLHELALWMPLSSPPPNRVHRWGQARWIPQLRHRRQGIVPQCKSMQLPEPCHCLRQTLCCLWRKCPFSESRFQLQSRRLYMFVVPSNLLEARGNLVFCGLAMHFHLEKLLKSFHHLSPNKEWVVPESFSRQWVRTSEQCTLGAHTLIPMSAKSSSNLNFWFSCSCSEESFRVACFSMSVYCERFWANTFFRKVFI